MESLLSLNLGEVDMLSYKNTLPELIEGEMYLQAKGQDAFWKTAEELGLTKLPKFRIVGDPNNHNKRFSTDVIVSSINEAAKKLNLYSDDEILGVYDCLGNDHGLPSKFSISCYELPYPEQVKKFCGNKLTITVSRDNYRLAIDGGMDPKQVRYVNLGVDSSKWQPLEKKYLLDKFVVLSYTESLARSGLEILLEGFKYAFSGNDNAVLYIKDRNATSEFIEYVNKYSYDNKINLKYENLHIGSIEEIQEVFSHADAHFYLNRSTTFGLTLCESMACGITTASPLYSGPRDFIVPGLSGIGIDHTIVPVHTELEELAAKGMRSFFLPLRSSDYWCKPSVKSVATNLKYLHDNREYCKKIGRQGAEFIKQFSWEKTALNISATLKEYYNL